MAKNRNKKKKNASSSMAMDTTYADQSTKDSAQDMDTSETVATNPSAGGVLRKVKHGRPMKRSKNVRKMKAVAKAISKTEKLEEKSVKSDSKTLRTKLSKNLYD